MRKRTGVGVLILLLCGIIAGCAEVGTAVSRSVPQEAASISIQEEADTAYVTVDGNVPDFTESELTTNAYESYGPLDALGRCTAAEACIGTELMPVEKRGSIGQVKPSGWQTVRYDFVDGKYLYNRCHLIGFQLTGENANERNLITGTRYMNVEGMLPFENMTADYIKETGNHVLYRVTPIFEGENLVASGVEMEALSVEDGGDGISFHVYAYNRQPGVTIDYSTGASRLAEPTKTGETAETRTYVLNTSSRKFHDPSCPSVSDIKESNKETYTGSREALLSQGYTPCGRCNAGDGSF